MIPCAALVVTVQVMTCTSIRRVSLVWPTVSLVAAMGILVLNLSMDRKWSNGRTPLPSLGRGGSSAPPEGPIRPF
jgi:hypothetical protein